MHLVLGTRGSTLARTQSEQTRQLLLAALPGVEIETRIIRTEGDRLQTAPLGPDDKLEKGLFTSALEDALARGEIDLAVHSLKDVPTELAPGMVLAAIPTREDPRDAFLSSGASFDGLPRGARVATGSPRRAAQLKLLRPDIEVVAVRGNVDTRISKLRAGEFDGMVLALSGLKRLGRADDAVELFGVERMLPAPGQGALAIEMRAGVDAERVAAAVDHAETRAAVVAERAVLTGIGGGCNLPLGTFAVVEGDELTLSALLFDAAGAAHRARVNGNATTPLEIGERAARVLLGRAENDP